MFSKLFSDEPADKKYKLAFLLILGAISFFNRIGESTIGFDDAVYAQKSKEMVLNGDWFYTFPTHGGRIHFDNKPPMLFWMLAGAGSIFGFTNFAMRLFPAIFGFASVITLFLFASYLTSSQRFGFFSAFILLFTQQFLYYGRSATPETLYTLLWLISLWCFKKALDENKNILYLAGGAAVGLAIITRHIPALFIYLVFIIFTFFSKETHKIVRNPYFFLGIFIAFIISAPWHLIMTIAHKSAFTESYFGTITRHGFKIRTAWYEYIRKIIENYWPWLPFFVAGIYHSVKHNTRNSAIDNIKTFYLKKRELVFVYSVIIPYFIIYQISSFRAVQYLVPLYPFMAIVSAQGLLVLDKNKMLLAKIFVGTGTVLAILWILFPILPKTLDSQEFSQLIKLVDTVKKIPAPIYTPEHPDMYHFRYGLLFYADRNVIAAKNAQDAIASLESNDRPYYFIIRKKLAKSYFQEKKPGITIAESKESKIIANQIGADLINLHPK